MIIFGIYGSINWNGNESYDSNDNSSWVHDSGATLFVNGKHICSIGEERLTRKKHEGNFPINSINYCLSISNIKREEVDIVCIPSMSPKLFQNSIFDGSLNLKIKEIFPNAEIKVFSHHLCHAAASVFSCDFNEGSFVTLDGSGTSVYDPYLKREIITECSSIGFFNKKNKIFRFYPSIANTNNFGSYYRLNSLSIYRKKTKQFFLGESEELRDSVSGKIMGLCAYGSYENYDWLDYKLSDYDFPFVIFKEFANEKTAFDDVYSMKSAEDMAAILQKNFEEAIVSYLSSLKNKSYLDEKICLSGGCFLNVLANTKIKLSSLFDQIHIPPFTNDSGLHFGAACYGLFLENTSIKLPNNIALLGKEYSDEEIESVLKSKNILYKKYDTFKEMCEITSNILSKNKIVAWFQGRSEFGPRALGSRSILMNPSIRENKDILNGRVKHREYWRPFAGVILEEKLKEYFNEDIESPYMLYSMTVKKEKKKSLSAIIHEDDTCRIQIINDDLNKQLTTLLKSYEQITGVPSLLNTSFNDNGEPIVETPEDAVECFLNIDVDFLVIGNFVVSKNDNKPPKKDNFYTYT